MWQRLKDWWQQWKNLGECERMERGYSCINRKCLGRKPH